MKKVYISGAIAHHPIEERKEAFAKKANVISKWGFKPVSPFDNGLDDSCSTEQHMMADVKMLLECDYIYMMRGWEKSNGAKLEHDIATSCGIEVLDYE